MVVTGIIGAVAGAGISIASDVAAGRDINWGRAGGAAAVGLLAGLTLGASAAAAATATPLVAGNAAASFSTVAGYGASATVATASTGSFTASSAKKFGENDLVLGLNRNGSLPNWVQEFGGKTFGKFISSSQSFAGQIKDAMTQATNIRVNLDGVDLNQINGMINHYGEPAAGYTNYELYLLKTMPEFLEKASSLFGLNNRI
jgi:hypothetical protein